MKSATLGTGMIVFLMLFIIASLGQPASAQSPGISTDKNTYVHGEKMKVSFSGSSGHAKDWISISKVGSPDNEAGDYDYIPQGLTQGTMTFEAPAPGKYEARGYYSYSRNGYVVSARCSFEVTASTSEGGLNPFFERKINPGNVLESQLPPGNGLVYIFNAYSVFLADKDVQIRANGTPVVVLSRQQCFPYTTPARRVRFTADTYFERDSSRGGEMTEVKAGSAGDMAIDVKPGCVYYLSLKVLPTPAWDISLRQVTYEEGDKLIKEGKMSTVK